MKASPWEGEVELISWVEWEQVGLGTIRIRLGGLENTGRNDSKELIRTWRGQGAYRNLTKVCIYVMVE